MLHRLTRAGLIWPTALSLVGLAVLIGLGTWQLQRKQWKDQLIAKIAARVAASPVTSTSPGSWPSRRLAGSLRSSGTKPRLTQTTCEGAHSSGV